MIWVAVYVVGAVIAARLLGRLLPSRDPRDIEVGILALLWPVLVAVAIPSAVIAVSAWLLTKVARR